MAAGMPPSLPPPVDHVEEAHSGQGVDSDGAACDARRAIEAWSAAADPRRQAEAFATATAWWPSQWHEGEQEGDRAPTAARTTGRRSPPAAHRGSQGAPQAAAGAADGHIVYTETCARAAAQLAEPQPGHETKETKKGTRVHDLSAWRSLPQCMKYGSQKAPSAAAGAADGHIDSTEPSAYSAALKAEPQTGHEAKEKHRGTRGKDHVTISSTEKRQ